MGERLITGINHVAHKTPDLDRLVCFYHEVLDVPVIAALRFPNPPGYRHYLFGLGTQAFLHVFEIPEADPETELGEIGQRGWIDHLALLVDNEEALHRVRDRLVSAGASSGEINDFGGIRSVHFKDPDGMDMEVAFMRQGVDQVVSEKDQHTMQDPDPVPALRRAET